MDALHRAEVAHREQTRLSNLGKVSIVIPVLNEAENIQELLLHVWRVLETNESVDGYEIIVVDDGSSDGTPQLLWNLKKEIPCLRALILRQNFGKSAALQAGFDHAQGDVIITMDGDLQDDPTEIPRFLTEISNGYDLVSGWKEKRQDSREKVYASRVFNRLASLATGVKLQDLNCGFKAYRAWCLRNIKLTGNLYRFLPVFVGKQGGKIKEIPVQHHARIHGQSKYGFKRYFEGAIDLCTIVLITSFFQRPLYFFALIGVPIMLIGLITGTYLVGGHIYYLATGNISFQLVNRPLLQISVTLFGLGLQIFLIGLLSELIISRTPGSQYNVKDSF